MKCPKCSCNAMSLGKSMVLFDPRRIRCQKCDAELKLSSQWVSVFWISIAVAFVVGLVHALLDNLFTSDNAAISIMIWIVVVFCYSVAFWHYATYEMLPVEGTSS